MTENAVPATGTAVGSTRTLLICGVIGGPLYIVVVAVQMLTRAGFDIGRHPASILSNGDLGWIQIGTFLASGLLLVAGAIGLRRVLGTGRGRTWGPRLIGVLGAGMVAAGLFSADPVDGFPPGTPAGAPTSISWHGLVHFLVAAVAFIALIAACFVFARRFAAADRRGWAASSTAIGAFFLASWMSIFIVPGSRPANIAFALAIALGLTWTSLLAAHHVTRSSERR